MNPSLLDFTRNLSQDLRAWLMPIGAGMEWWADETDVPGPQSGKRWFIFPAGQDILQSEYPRLYALWCKNGVHKYGVGSVANSTKAPDKRGRVAVARDDMGGTAANRITSGGSGITGTTLGAAGGFETHQLTTAQIPSHQHGQTAVYDQGGGAPWNGPYTGSAAGLVWADTIIAVNSATQAQGGGGVHQNTQPTIISNYIIRAG